MTRSLQTLIALGLAAFPGMSYPGPGLSQTPVPAPSSRDGQHDLDFNIGVWKTHIKRFLDPFEGGEKSIDLDGTVTVRKVWDGKAQLEEIEADGPEGHWEGLNLLLYNPKAHQWSQTFVNSRLGTMSPPNIGEFKDGRIVLISQDIVNGRSILVKAVWSDIQPNSHRYEESFSADGGVTWVRALLANLVRS